MVAVGRQLAVVRREAYSIKGQLGIGEVEPVVITRRRALHSQREVENPHPPQCAAGGRCFLGQLVRNTIHEGGQRDRGQQASPLETLAVGELQPALAEVDAHHLALELEILDTIGHRIGEETDPSAAWVAEGGVVADRALMQTERPIHNLFELRLWHVAADPVETQLLGRGAVELGVVGEEKVAGQTLAEAIEHPFAEISGFLAPIPPPCPHEAEQTVPPHIRGQSVGVDLYRVGCRVAAYDHRRAPFVNRELIPDSELGQVGLGFGPRHVQQMSRIVEDIAVGSQAAARAARLRLAFEHHRRRPGPFEPLGRHQPGQASADNQDPLHQSSMGTAASHTRKPRTTAPTTAVRMSVDTGSRKSTTNPSAPKTTATA